MSASRAPATWAATIIAFVGLGLILLGGCFLIGIEGMPTHGNASGMVLFEAVLYGCAFACFGGAIWLLIIGVSRMIKISKGE